VKGFRHVHVLKTQEEVDAAVFQRQAMWNNRKSERGPFDIIGDVHGCCDEQEELLQQLGYGRNGDGAWNHREGRRAIFVDLVDRGPRIADTLKTVMTMSQVGSALCVPGNHEIKLKRKLEGRDVTVSHGLDRTLAELDQQTPKLRRYEGRNAGPGLGKGS
jgi:protein phosphatase